MIEIVVVQRDSEAWRHLQRVMAEPKVDRVSITIDGGRLKVKANGDMWSPPLEHTPPSS